MLEFLREDLDNFDIPIIIVDEHHTIKDVNRNFLETFVVKRDSVVGRKCWEFFHTKGEMIKTCPLESVISHGELAQVEDYVHALDKRQLIVHILLDEASHPETSVAILALDTGYILNQIIDLLKFRSFVKSAFEISEVPLLRLDEQFRIISANRAFQQTFGFQKDELSGESIFKIGDRCFELQPLRELFETLKNSEIFTSSKEFSHYFPRIGDKIILATLLQAPIGKSKQFILRLLDLTQQKKLERELRETGLSYRILADESFEGIAIMQHGKYKYVNEAFAAQIGVPKEKALELTNEEIWARVHPDDVRSLKERGELLEEGVRILPRHRFRYIRPDGSVCWVDSFVKKIEFLGEPANLIFQVDMTEYVHIVEELRRKESRLNTILEMSPVAIAVFDSKGNLQEASHSILEFLGIESVAFLRNINLLEDPLLSSEVRQRIRDNERIFFEMTVDFERVKQARLYPTTRKGIAYVKVGIAPLQLDQNSTVDGYIVQIFDITEQKLAEKKYSTAAEIAFLMADILAHDLRNYLQKIQIAGEILQQQQLLPTQKVSVDIILETISRASKMISDVIGLQKLIFTPIEDQRLDKAVDETVAEIKQKFDNVEIKVTCQPDQPVVIADKYLTQLLNIIIENAIVHNDKDRKRVWITIKKNKGHYSVSIADNGPGLTNLMKKSVLNPMKRAGGVGLFRAQLILKKYGGDLIVRDRVAGRPSLGAEFCLLFPKGD